MIHLRFESSQFEEAIEQKDSPVNLILLTGNDGLSHVGHQLLGRDLMDTDLAVLDLQAVHNALINRTVAQSRRLRPVPTVRDEIARGFAQGSELR
jgi:hypothetical protein